MPHQRDHWASHRLSCPLLRLYSYVGAVATRVYKAASTDPDTLSFDQALQDKSNLGEWIKAANKEIQDLAKRGIWIEVDQSDAKTRILPGTWVFRRKRRPDGTIKKYKARYCVRGDLQEGSFETFAPVVSWPAVRFMLIHSFISGWVTCSIDFEQAFIQSNLPSPVWIHLPRGFTSDRQGRTCLRLIKSLYGLREAPLVWLITVLKA